MNEFLQNFSNPVINTNTARHLDSPLSLEVLNAIKAMQSKKARGPDRFPIEFFKAFLVNWHRYFYPYSMYP